MSEEHNDGYEQGFQLGYEVCKRDLELRIAELQEALQQEHERAEKLASAYSTDGHSLRKRIAELEEENERLKQLEIVAEPDFILKMCGCVVQLEEALRFYADRENYKFRLIDLQNPLVLDYGAKARAVLPPSEAAEKKEE